jgi:glutamine synthetase
MEQYVKTVNVEQKVTIKLARTTILPAALRYQKELAETAAATKAAGATPDTKTLATVSDLIGKLTTATGELESAAAAHSDGLLAEAKHLRDAVLPAMLKVRDVVDTLEGVLADDLWPLPSYQEMCFIK